MANPNAQDVRVKPDERKFAVTVIYNGLEREVEVNSEQAVQAVLAHAINAFGNLPQPHLLSLWTEGGAEIPDNSKVDDAGIRKGARLLLRPSAVKGG